MECFGCPDKKSEINRIAKGQGAAQQWRKASPPVDLPKDSKTFLIDFYWEYT